MKYKTPNLAAPQATKDEIRDPAFYSWVLQETREKVPAIGIASGFGRANYPINVRVIDAPMYHKGDKRADGIRELHVAAESAAANGTVVVINCNKSFHSGTLLMSAVCALAGFSVRDTLTNINRTRHIWPGHFLPPDKWQDDDSNHEADMIDARASVERLQTQVLQTQAARQPQAPLNAPAARSQPRGTVSSLLPPSRGASASGSASAWGSASGLQPAGAASASSAAGAASDSASGLQLGPSLAQQMRESSADKRRAKAAALAAPPPAAAAAPVAPPPAPAQAAPPPAAFNAAFDAAFTEAEILTIANHCAAERNKTGGVTAAGGKEEKLVKSVNQVIKSRKFAKQE